MGALKKFAEKWQLRRIPEGPVSFQGISGIRVIQKADKAQKTYLLYILKGPLKIHDLKSAGSGTHILLPTGSFEDQDLVCAARERGRTLFCSGIQGDGETMAEEMLAAFEYEQRLAGFSRQLSEALFHDASVQEMTELAFLVMGNPIFIFNAAFKLIAANDSSENMDAHSLQILHEGGFTQYDFDFVNHYFYRSRPLHEQVKKSPIPVLAKDETLGRYRLILCFDPVKDIGHIVVSDFYKPIEDIDYDFLTIFRDFVYEKLQQSEFIKNTKGFPYEFFLSDLLDKKVTSPRGLQSRYNYVNREFSHDLYCFVVETARSFNTVNIHRVRSELEGLFPGVKTILYQGQIVGVLSHKPEECFSQENVELLRNFCVNQGIFCGMSNRFENIFNLPDYYKQALRAIELGAAQDNSPGLFIYKDHFMEHVAHVFKQGESAEVFASPQLKRLMDYDKKNETDFAYTLYIYLIYERSLTLTASHLFVHRNTLVYRMKKIAALVPYDAMSAKERLYYIISYEFMV